MATQGTWGIGSIKLPDFGITEALGLGKPNPNLDSNGMANWPQYQAPAGTQTAPTYAGPAVPYGPKVPVNNAPAGPAVPSNFQFNPGNGSSSTGGSVLGASTFQAPTQQTINPYSGLQSDISSSWDQYINSLNDQLGGLEQQRQAQEGIAGNQFTQGVNTLGQQKAQSEQSVNENQAKTLRDISSNIRNSFMAGNVYLGARGAGDSSAANQYSLALGKEGTRQRSDVMQQSAGLLKNIGDVYNNGVKQLELEKNNKVMEIANWFAGAQNQLKQMQAQGQLSKSQDLQNLSRDILNQALSQMNTIQQEASNRRSALESWAMSQSQNAQQLGSNMSALAKNVPGFSAISGTPQVDSAGNFTVPTGMGSTSSVQRDIFGNIIRQ